MRKIILIFGLLLVVSKLLYGQIKNCENCIEYTLEIEGNKLIGSSLQLAGYDVSMHLPGNFAGDSLCMEYLLKTISNNDIEGEFIFPNGRTTKIKYSIVTYRGSKTVYMKTSNGWYPWENFKIENRKLIFSYDYWFCPPATKKDLKVINLCFRYLNNSASWHQKDDRKCDNDVKEKKWSLFCAIRNASVKKFGEYNHRGYVIQTARFVIDELNPNHGYSHTLMDFNNDPSTKFEDIRKILEIIKSRIKKELTINE